MIDIFGSWWFIGLIGICIGVIFSLVFIDWQRPDGVIHVTQGDDTDKYLFEFNIQPEDIPKKKQIVFKVTIESQNLHSV